jgi:hypothetical protein
MGTFFFLALAFSLTASSQGIINDGGYINIETGGWVHVDGDALGMYTNYTNGSYDGTIDIDGTLEVEGNWSNFAASNIFVNRDRNGTVILDGTTRQIIGGSTPSFFENLTTDNLADIQMNVDNSANGVLYLINGAYILNSHTMTIENIPTNAISRVNGYIISETIDGNPNPCYSRINWVVENGTGIYVIPFATYAANLIPFQFEITTPGVGTGGIVVATYHSAVDNAPYADYPSTVSSILDPWGLDNTANTADRYWLVDYSGFSSNPVATLQVTYDGVTDSDTITESHLQAQPWDGSGWLPLMGTSDDVNNTVGNITGVDRSYVWTLSNYANPSLPVELLDFNAWCAGEAVKLKWTTGSETDNDYFTVERSGNTIDWEGIATVNGSGTSNQMQNYAAWDNYPLQNDAYYRLKQTDYNGNFSLSTMVMINCLEEQEGNQLISVVISENNIIVSYLGSGEIKTNLGIYNVQGQLVKSLPEMSLSESNDKVIINIGDISQGVYLLNIMNSVELYAEKVMIY